MKPYFKDLNVPAASTSNGTAVKVENYRDKTVQIFGTFAATLEIQASLNGTDFFAVQASITAPNIYALPQTCSHVRVRNVTHVSGVPQARFGGFDSRSDGG